MSHLRTLAPSRRGAATTGLVALAVLVLYTLLLDQGALLAPLTGAADNIGAFLHEFAHDARHLLGAPCH